MADQQLIRIPEFRGLWQRGGGKQGDLRYAQECVNAQVSQGVLRPMTALLHLPGDLPGPIETLCRLHRRYHAAPEEKDVLVAASGGQLYWRLPKGEGWTRLALPPEMAAYAYQSSRWSCVSYEINPEGSAAPIDVLIMSNEKDGMICIRGDSMTVSLVETPRKFGVIARHAERIWGGAIEGDGDMLCYSAPYDPFDWAQNNDAPEDGAGDVLQPSWDGDGFTALLPFGSQLIAFKKTRAWRVLGLNPGEYVFSEQFGGGAPYAQTIAVDTARMLLLSPDGLCLYDGESVTPFWQDAARLVFDRMNPGALRGAAACLHKGVYYCALPLDESPRNNAVLLYDTVENTWDLREGIAVSGFLSMEDGLYLTSAVRPGALYQWTDVGESLPMRWTSAWQEEDKHLLKGPFDCYLTTRGACEITLGVETERGKCEKRIRLEDGKPKRVRLRIRGRRFRLHLKSASKAPWRIEGGMQLTMDREEDA